MKPADVDGRIEVRIDRLRVHDDARGSLYEPLDDRDLAAQRNVHVVLTHPAAVRGNHYHRRATETTAVMGPCRVRLKEGDVLRDVDVPAGEAWRFTIPPGVVHAYQNTGDGLLVLVSFSSIPHDPAATDTVREVIL